MANVSSTFGEVTITSPSKKSIEALLKLQEIAERRSAYETKIEVAEIKKSGEEYVFYSTFWADGRWNFSSNVNWFFDCVNSESDNEEVASLSKEIDSAISVEFNFTDSEQGCDFICTGVATLERSIDGKVSIDYNVTDEVSYTVDNLLAYDIYEFGELVSISYLLKGDNFDRYFANNEKILPLKDAILAILEEEEYKEEVFYDFDEIIDDVPALAELLEQ